MCRTIRILAIALQVCAAAFAAQADSRRNDVTLGQETFSACAGCHGLDGAGGEHAPNIATNTRVQQMSDSALLAIIRNGIPAAGMPSFNQLLTAQQMHAVLQYLRVLQGARPNAKLPGNPKNGRDLFFGRAGCASCHMVNGRGGFIGTDLSGYGQTHSPADIRKSIVAPNDNLDTRRSAVTVVTQAGKTYRGLVRNEDNFSLQMQTPDGAFHLFDKRSLSRVDREQVTLMPADYGQKLSSSDLDDLIGFLSQYAAGGDKQEDESDE